MRAFSVTRHAETGFEQSITSVRPWLQELDASVLARIPVRLNTDDRYFSVGLNAVPFQLNLALYF
jgi:hypothetical protein